MFGFFEESISVADNFIKTICFIDDQPFFNHSEDPANEDIDHTLNANAITKAFAPTGKCCAFYQYNHENEEKDILNLTKVADVNILDWRIVFTKPVALDVTPVTLGDDLLESSNASPKTNDESIVDRSEEDVEEKESRGRYTLQLIEGILRQEYTSPKLIIVFTAEPFPEEIFSAIKEKLTELDIEYTESLNELWLQNNRFRIAIYFKEMPNQKHLPIEIRKKILLTADFPDMVNREFATLTTGFVSLAAIECISSVRANTFLLLDAYNKELDSAYLAHRALLPNSDDAEEHLVEVIGSDIKGILKSSSLISDLKRRIAKYLESNYSDDDYEMYIDDLEKMPSLGLSKTISKSTLHSIVLNGIENTFFQKDQSFEEKIHFTKNCHKWLTKTFASTEKVADESNILFAVRTTIKPTYNQSAFLLSLGTIVKEEANDNHWLCIQPKCDSVRIEQKKRAFLFLRLKAASQDNFHIVIQNNGSIFLKVDYRIYSSQAIDFIKDGNGSVSSFIENNIVKFRRGDNKNMIWVAELKSDFSQSISNKFSSELSRVGLDLSEWLRRCS